MELVHERRGSGEPLVLLHAYGLRWQSFEPVLDLLAEHHDVIAVDLPGFGASPPLPKGVRYSVPSICDALENFFGRLGIERPHIAGNSLGGLLSLELACRGTVRTATAIAPPGFYSVAGAARTASIAVPGVVLASKLPLRLQSGALRAPWVRKIACTMISARPGSVSDEVLLGHAGAMRGSAAALPLVFGMRSHAFFRGQPRVPVTLVWATRDRIVAGGHASRAAKALPEARHIWLPLCGHVPMYDDPARVTEAVLEGAAARAARSAAEPLADDEPLGPAVPPLAPYEYG